MKDFNRYHFFIRLGKKGQMIIRLKTIVRNRL